MVVTVHCVWNHSPDVFEKRITMDWLPEVSSIRCQNALEQKLVCDLVYTVVAYSSWLIKVMLQNRMHGTFNIPGARSCQRLSGSQGRSAAWMD